MVVDLQDDGHIDHEPLLVDAKADSLQARLSRVAGRLFDIGSQ